jgi:O-antigen biosynthesis protein
MIGRNTMGRMVRAMRRPETHPTSPGQLAPRPPVERRASDPFLAYRSIDGPVLVDAPGAHHDAARDGDPRLVVLLPELDAQRMTGGPTTILQVAARVASAGIPTRLVATTSGGTMSTDDALLAHIAAATGVQAPAGRITFEAVRGPEASLAVGADDVLLATFWPTAYTASAALGCTRPDAFLYLIQDYEAAFYGWSPRGALAEATYGMPIRAIVNEPFVERYLLDLRVGRFADPSVPRTTFLPAVDREVFMRRSRPPGAPRRLVFYARPRNPRNLFEIGLRVLREAAARGVFDHEPWELLAIGQDLTELSLGGQHLLRPVPWASYLGYADLLGSSDILLSLMQSPHTSYPPLEMATAGGLVVTTTYGAKTVDALTALSPRIRAAAPGVEPLVAALTQAEADVRSGRVPDGQVRGLPGSWDEALQDTVPWIVRQIEELRTARTS